MKAAPAVSNMGHHVSVCITLSLDMPNPPILTSPPAKLEPEFQVPDALAQDISLPASSVRDRCRFCRAVFDPDSEKALRSFSLEAPISLAL
jgi:hypothetical protein